MSKFIVIADDFTGANDTGVQLTKKGVSVTVALADAPVDCDIMVINTETRAASTEDAVQAVSAAVRNNISDDTTVVFKKIDSTFRGNIGAELDAAASAFDADLIVVASAIPAAGRTIIDGRCLVNGIPLAQTEFANDSKTPVRFSKIDRIIGVQSKTACRNVKLDDIRAGRLPAVLNQSADSGEQTIVITDAASDADLATVAHALAQVNRKILLVGAAGIAGQLPRSLITAKDPLPVLILAGSMSDVVKIQVENCSAHGLEVINVDSHDIWHRPDDTLDRTLTAAGALLDRGMHCVIRTAVHENERRRAAEFCAARNITGTQLGIAVAGFFGKMGKRLMNTRQFSGMLLTGGDIAIAVAEHIGADGYVIEGEVLPCIPYGHFTGYKTMVVTKAGGFGAPDAMEQIIRFIQENS